MRIDFADTLDLIFMATNTLQRRLLVGTTICGLSATLLVMILEISGALAPLERWMYDRRAKDCQFFQPAPSDLITHLDIDDESLIAVGHWPWRRRVVADILDELAIAEPKAVAIDVMFAEPELIKVDLPDGKHVKIEEDNRLVDAIKRLKSTVMAISVIFKPPIDADTAWQQTAVAELMRNVNLSDAEVTARIAPSTTIAGLAERVRADFPELRARAIHDILTDRMARSEVSLERITEVLTGVSLAASTQSAINENSPVTRMIATQFARVQAELATRKVTLKTDSNTSVKPVDVLFNNVPVTYFSEAMASGGFVDHDMFDESIVRAVPLFVQQGDQVYPQFGLALACRALDADITNARITDDAVYIPSPKGEIRIPVRQVYASVVKRNVGAVMDVPWFGTNDWRTMYDFPRHKVIARHISVNAVWEVVRFREKLVDNNLAIDVALQPLLDTISKTRAGAYRDLKLAPEDFAGRKAQAVTILDDVSADQFEQFFKGKPDAELQPDEVVQRRSISAVRRLLVQNEELLTLIDKQRAFLKTNFGGKAVFVGWVASGAADLVSTPIYARCPGVVVHGAIANAILTGHFKRTAPHWMTLVITILFGAGATFVTSRLHPPAAIGAVMAMAATYFVINGIALYDKLDLIVGVASPLVAVILCWGSCTAFRLIVEGLERLRLSKEAAALDHEISLARRIQAALIPKVMRPLPEIDSHGWTMAASTTGGDCFDLWKLADGRLGILVADASGHGLGPSMIVSQTRALVRALCDLYPEPQKLLDRINARMAVDLDGSKFCTTFVGYMDAAGKIEWGSAGHGPMLWCSCQTGQLLELEGTGLPLGVSEDWFGEETVPALMLDHGGTLIVISDGIFEAPNPKGEQFDVQRVKDILHNHCSECPEKLIDLIRVAVREWQGNDEPHDDQTIVIVRRATADDATAPIEEVSPAPDAI